MEGGSVNSKSEGLLSRMALNDNKAGMEGLDRDKINKIIMESSKVNNNLCTNPYREIWTLDLIQLSRGYLETYPRVQLFFLLFILCAGI